MHTQSSIIYCPPLLISYKCILEIQLSNRARDIHNTLAHLEHTLLQVWRVHRLVEAGYDRDDVRGGHNHTRFTSGKSEDGRIRTSTLQVWNLLR